MLKNIIISDAWQLAYARVGFAGKSPYAPGTCGSLAAVALAPFIFMPFPVWVRILILAALYWTGAKASGRAEELLGEKDPGQVVIDEVLGQWIVCLPFAALSFREYVLAFIFFRLFDILKPWPVRPLENIPGGHGIMLDDAMAGLYGMTCLGVAQWLFL